MFLQGFCFSNSPNPPPPTQKLNDLSLTVQQDFFQKVQYLKHGIYPHLQVAIFFLEGFLFECKNKYLSLPFLACWGNSVFFGRRYPCVFWRIWCEKVVLPGNLNRPILWVCCYGFISSSKHCTVLAFHWDELWALNSSVSASKLQQNNSNFLFSFLTKRIKFK